MFNFLESDEPPIININNIDRLIGKIELIDIREEDEYENASIKTAKNIPMSELLDDPEKYLNKNKEYYIMCQSGRRSAMACFDLLDQGFKVVNVSGGMGSYVGTKIK